jgi:hypothetical protein
MRIAAHFVGFIAFAWIFWISFAYVASGGQPGFEAWGVATGFSVVGAPLGYLAFSGLSHFIFRGKRILPIIIYGSLALLMLPIAFLSVATESTRSVADWEQWVVGPMLFIAPLLLSAVAREIILMSSETLNSILSRFRT